MPVIYQNFTYLDDTDSQNHEIRLNGELDNGVIYQLGGFYFKETLDRDGGFFIAFIGPNGSYLDYFTRDVESESQSLFGQVDVPFSENLTGVGGLRWTDNERSAVYTNNGAFGAMGPTALFNAGSARPSPSQLTNPALNLGNAEDELTWLLGLNYTPDAETLIYGKASTGFKGGGFDSVGPYKPESNTANEAGVKKQLGNNPGNYFNVSGYIYDYTDLQVSVLLDTSVGGQTFNAGEATISGLEADLQYQVSENGVLTASANLLNSEFDTFLGLYNAFCIEPAGCGLTGIGDLDPLAAGVQQPDFAGNTTAFSPEWVFTLGYSHIIDLADSGSLTASLFSRYKSSYYTDYFNYADAQQDAYTQTDVSLKWTSENEIWSIQAFVRNLEDELPLTYAGFIAAGPDDIFNFQFGRPRTSGISLNMNF